jgi:flagellar hook-associated protein 2
VGSPITFTGFNDIDFGMILTAIMTQESQPLTALQRQQSAVQSKINNFTTLTTKTSTLETAATALSTARSLASFAATSTVPTSVGVSAGSAATAGHYDIVVKELARAQVTASGSSLPGATAGTGTFAINGKSVAVTAGMTLNQLASTINEDATLAATASVVQDGAASFRLVLTAKTTGEASAFTVATTLTGVTFSTTGDPLVDNAVQATDARLTVNNIEVKGASNTLEGVIPGTSLTLYKKDATAVIGVDVVADNSDLKTKLSGFITAYNDLVKFVAAQTNAAASGDDSSIARDPLVRQLRNTLRSSLNASYGAGALKNLALIGVEFVKNSGTLTLKDAAFAKALEGGTAGMTNLFTGTTGAPGVFASIRSVLDTYTQTAGLLSDAQAQLNKQISKMGDQVTRMQGRLEIRRSSLQREFTAADTAMTQLKSQSSSLNSLFG